MVRASQRLSGGCGSDLHHGHIEVVFLRYELDQRSSIIQLIISLQMFVILALQLDRQFEGLHAAAI